jgi:predicted Rossmann fold flavoprotein
MKIAGKTIHKKPKNTPENGVYDVIVIGAGPAGMIAAGRSAERGLKTLIIEKNPAPGKKLLITGGGRCNVTNAETDNRKLLEKFKDSGKFLFSTFSQFSVKESLDFFNSRGMETKVEEFKRVFPVSDRSESVLNVLLEYMQSGGVEILTDTEVLDINTTTEDNKKINSIKVKSGGKISELKAENYILATGGTSHRETGSTGDGFNWLKKIGHTVIEPEASLVPIKSSDKWIKTLQGITLEKVKVTVTQNNVKQNSKLGRVLFTHFGLSGPTILNLSSEIRELLKYGEVKVVLDLTPDMDHGKLNDRLQSLFIDNNKKKIKNSLDEIIPSSLIPIVLEFSNIDPDTENNSVKREERLKLIEIIKNLEINIDGILGKDKAIISSGGVKLEEVDFKTMQSRIFQNLYLIGDILNIDRPSGGYSLQLCWSTGYVAGNSTKKP